MVEIVSLVNVDYIWLLLTPLLSYMLYDFMQDGMIFERYGKWLETINKTIAKPLGLCLKCFFVWVFILVWLCLNIGIFIVFVKFILLLSLAYLFLLKLFF